MKFAPRKPFCGQIIVTVIIQKRFDGWLEALSPPHRQPLSSSISYGSYHRGVAITGEAQRFINASDKIFLRG